MRCRCHSGKTERRCCGPLHAGRPAPSPLALMRSRYAAYASGNVDYIVRTTHPDSPHADPDHAAWRDALRAFCTATRFEGLSILDAPPAEGDRGTVTFRAALRQGDVDASFEERSRFVRVDGRWMYLNGEAP